MKTYSSKSTIKTYATATTHFFKTVYGEASREDLDTPSDKYFTENRNYTADITNFFVSIKDRPPKTIQIWLAAVKQFFIQNDVEFPQKFWKTFKRRTNGSEAVTEDKAPSTKELRQILNHMDVKGKAFYLVLASSGMRIGEAVQLKEGDLDSSQAPTKIFIRGEYTKSGNKRTAFISAEAVEVLNQWLIIKRKYIEGAIQRSRKKGNPEDAKKLFPFTVANMVAIWNNALDKAQLNGRDQTTNRRIFHPHVLRKFFRSQMAKAIPVDIVEAIMGHEGYLTSSYRKYSDEEKAEFYLKGESRVTIFLADTDKVAKLEAEVEQQRGTQQALIDALTAKTMRLEEENLTFQKMMGALITENKGYKEDLAQLQKNFNDLKDLVLALRKDKT